MKIIESIYIDKNTNNIIFDYNVNNKSGINTNIGKINNTTNKQIRFLPRSTKLINSNVEVLSLYVKDIHQDTSEILLALKGKSKKYFVDSNNYNTFIKRTAIIFASIIKKRNIDTILLMQSSSTLIKDIASILQVTMPNKNIKLITDGVIKNIENLTIDIPENANEQMKKDLLRVYNNIKKNNVFEIKKIFGKYRQFFHNWISINRNSIKNITNKNVLIIDDYLISGSTLDELCLTLQSLNPENITVMTILKA